MEIPLFLVFLRMQSCDTMSVVGCWVELHVSTDTGENHQCNQLVAMPCYSYISKEKEL